MQGIFIILFFVFNIFHNSKFPFRDVFCSENLLNCDEKVDWRACKLDVDSETSLVKNFREKFAKYDFTT